MKIFGPRKDTEFHGKREGYIHPEGHEAHEEEREGGDEMEETATTSGHEFIWSIRWSR